MGALLTGLSCVLLAGCRDAGGRSQAPRTGSGRQADRGQDAPADSRPAILFLGTSLTAGLGVEPDSAYPAVLQRRLDSLGLPWRVINGGVSGETSAGLLRRLPWQLQGPLGIVVVETGGNDGLRGLDVDSTRANLDAIIRQVRAHDGTTRIVVVGMQAPPNMGPRFTQRFGALFPDLARRERLTLIPFLLTGVAGVDSLNQADGIHPTPAGQRIVADNVWQVLGPMVAR
jgi:acyl-CoA thioesterase-1